MIDSKKAALISSNRFEEINYATFETDLVKYRIMAGGAPMLERVDPHGEESKYVPSIDGVIVSAKRNNVYFISDYTGKSSSPTCASHDGIRGEGEPGGLCDECPLNQYGSGRGGKSKACKNKLKLYIQVPGEEFPSILALPATSIASYDKYREAVESAGHDVSQVITRIKIQKTQNGGGIAYSRTVFEGLGVVSDADLDRLAESHQNIASSNTNKKHQPTVNHNEMTAHLDRIVTIF